MKARKYTEAQIIAVLKEGEAGAKVAVLCRKYGMSEATYYNLKVKYFNTGVSDLKRLKVLEAANLRLKHIIAEQALIITRSKSYSLKTFTARYKKTDSS